MPDLDAEADLALVHRLAGRLAACERIVSADPFANPILIFAQELTSELASGALGLEALEQAVRALTVKAFAGRAERLGRYLGAGEAPDAETLFEALADRGDFDAYAAALSRPPYGLVLTAHPTFSLNRPLSEALVELAMSRDARGEPLDGAGRAARLKLAHDLPHRPPEGLTLDLEHAWSVEALEHACDALDLGRAAALRVGRQRWPDRWRELDPQLMTLATWVGFDQDGRTDVTWMVSMDKRLDLKRRAILRRRAEVAGLATGADSAWGERLDLVLALLNAAQASVEGQLAALAAARADPQATPAFARAMVAGREASLADPAPLLSALDAALAHAPNEAACERLLVIRAGLAAQGLSLAHIHVRLNSAQLHNAIRAQVGLTTVPEDPAHRRAYFAAMEDLLEAAEPQAISFASLVEEPASAKRLMMTLAQMAKFIDPAPVRFLIAEAESGFTLLVALYYARLFGVEHLIEISPLFETEAGLVRGEAVIEEALRSRHYREHLARQGRVALEFGFSDSGRFIGQMAATFRIERLRLRLAELLEAEGLSGLEVVLFGTHGESIGRGGHPASLTDRLSYVAPPQSRAEFAARGMAVREETSFQGGEGYLPFLNAAAASATVAGLLDFAFAAMAETGDPIYAAPEFASDFFATIQQAFSDVVEDPDYVALLSLYGTRMLHKTGSRPEQRQRDTGGRPRSFEKVSELRAIPNNGVLQQLGYLANTVFGLGAAAVKDRRNYDDLRARSPRFGQAMAMAAAADTFSDIDVVRAYGAIADPDLWLAQAACTEGAEPACLALAALTDEAGLSEPLARVLRSFRAEDLRLAAVGGRPDPERGAALRLLHALRVAVIQAIARLAAAVPAFAPREDATREQLQERLIRLDIPAAVAKLAEIFPATKADDALAAADWGEPAGYPPEASHAYAEMHATLLQPLLRLHALALDLTSAITHEIGACG